LDQKAAVTIHRPAHIAKQHDAGFLDAPFAIDQFDDLTAEFHVVAHGPAQIDDVASARALLAPADLSGDLGGDQQNSPGDGAAFLDAHLAEVLAIESEEPTSELQSRG